MLNRHHFFRNSLCLILTLSLILLPAGCGENFENTDSSISIGTSNEADSSLASNAADTALPQGTETPGKAEMIEDKFVMLREVYDILSGPLGEPYRTPEYWGGEEIDMMKVGDDYLIGLRNVKNQMHYLLYERETDSIIEINTQGKRIIWEDIEMQDNQLILPSYHISRNSSETAINNEIIYDLASKEYTYNSHSSSLDFCWEMMFDIPSPAIKEETSDFSCLIECYQALQTLPFQDPIRYNQFLENEICILNQDDYILIRSGGWTSTYYFYPKASIPPCVKPLEVFSTDWEAARFQSGTELYFPYPGFKVPSAYVIHFFPYTLSYNTETARYTIHPVPLLNNPKFDFLPLGLEYNRAHSQIYHLFYSNKQEFPSEYFTSYAVQDAPGFSLLFEMLDNSGGVDVIFPKISFSSEGQQVALEFLGMSAEPAIQEKIRSLRVEGFTDFEIRELSEKEEEKLVLTFTVESGYQLYGELGLSSIPGDDGGYLSFWAVKA